LYKKEKLLIAGFNIIIFKPLIIEKLLKPWLAIMGVRRGGGKWAFPPLETGTMSQKFLENLKSKA